MDYLAFDLGAESGRAILAGFNPECYCERSHRFPNEPVRYQGELHWDVLRLWREMNKAFASLPKIESIGIDNLGVDFALIGERETCWKPFHYRDTRTEGIMEVVFSRMSREAIYSVTGIQFLPFNTLYQLYAACRSTPRLIDSADALVTIPDLLNYWMSGNLVSEYTNATTTQLIDARTRTWATDLLKEPGLRLAC